MRWVPVGEVRGSVEDGLDYVCVCIHQVRSITLSWAVPSGYGEYLSKPSAYWSHLIGHEGEGSVLAALKKRYRALIMTSQGRWPCRHLATGLVAGAGYSYLDAATFDVRIPVRVCWLWV